MQLFYQPDILQSSPYLNTEESRHCSKVLRKKVGDEITVVDGQGCFYVCRIIDNNVKKCLFEVITKQTENKKNYSIHIAIAPTKNVERLEWFVEKATELGIDEISLVICQNSERSVVKTDRLLRKAIAAMKQSKRASLPKINEAVALKTFFQAIQTEARFIAFVDPENQQELFSVAGKHVNTCVLIGPEGDFSLEEIDAAEKLGWQKVGLGPYRLRTETAGLAACHILNLLNY